MSISPGLQSNSGLLLYCLAGAVAFLTLVAGVFFESRRCGRRPTRKYVAAIVTLTALGLGSTVIWRSVFPWFVAYAVCAIISMFVFSRWKRETSVGPPGSAGSRGASKDS